MTQGTGYVAPVVTLEFGGRATDEPHQACAVTCDIAEHLTEVSFSAATPLVMSVARTFWEKATAAHVFCAQGIVPEGKALEALAKDYEAMLADDLMVGDAMHFDALMDACAELEVTMNGVARRQKK